MGIRFAAPADSPALRHIYGQYIDTGITFEETLPSEAAFLARVEAVQGTYPYLVWEQDGAIWGYAYAHRQKERGAYQWNAELSVYLDGQATGRGIGKRLYETLIALLRLQGVRTVYGGVVLPNAPSEALHESLGFRLLGVYENTGYKAGAWRSVGCFEKQIAPYDPDPAPIIPMGQLPTQQVQSLLATLGQAQ